MRIISSDGNYDIAYDQVSLKQSGNRLEALPLSSRMLDKPITLKIYPSNNDVLIALKQIRLMYAKGQKIVYLSPKMGEQELAEFNDL